MPTLTHRILADSPSVVHVLARRAAEHPQRVAFRFLEDGEHESARMTYAELEAKAQALAARLSTFTEPGDRALFVYPPCLDFVVAFFGCLMARVVPVPVYPPRQDRSFERLAAVVRDASATLVMTTQGVMEHSRAGFDRLEGCEALRWVPTDAMADGEPEFRPARAVVADDLAFLQYTSGSTGDPKGVVVRHRNLVANIGMVYQVLRCPEEFVSVSWLPQFHDMGLIGTTLYPLCAGGTSVARCRRRRSCSGPGVGSKPFRPTAATSPPPQFRLRTLLPQGEGGRPGEARPQWLGARPQRRGAHSPRHAGALQRAVRAGRSGRLKRCCRATAWPRPRSSSRASRRDGCSRRCASTGRCWSVTT